MKTYQVTFVGTQPLLLHADNIEWADMMSEWQKDPRNKSTSKAGDDRTPPWRWVGCLYHNNSILTIPTENVMRCLMEAAAQVPTGKGPKTFKSQSQSGIIPIEFHWPLLVHGEPIDLSDVNSIRGLSFKDQTEAVKALGFSLFVKRAKLKASKHIRVRPMFSDWSITGELAVTDSQISKDILTQILEIAGSQKGLGDWRPGCKTPGPWGIFKAEIQ